MSNIDVVWDNANCRGDWRITGGRLSTGNLLVTAVIISLFTDRVARPDDKLGADGRRGWWMDSFDGVQIGSRLWQLRRRKVANRGALSAEAADMAREALQWLVTNGIAKSVQVDIDFPPAGPGRAGTLLRFAITIAQPDSTVPVIRVLWSTV